MITIRLDSPVSLGEQVRLGIREAIARGELHAGDALPTVRQLANDLDINFNTVSRAYRDLEREGLVATVQGRGTIVARETETVRLPAREMQERIARDLHVLLTDARLAGIPPETLKRMFDTETARFWPREEKTR
jgi:GntR family transcriptional regulator